MNYKSILYALFLLVVSVEARTGNSLFSYNDLALSGMNILETNKKVSNDAFNFYYQFETSEKKSVGKALLLSLLLPGLGEFYAGNQTQGQLFLGAEILIWGGFAVNDFYANSLEKDYKNFARRHAGVTGSGADEQYWVDIGKFDDIYAYNSRRENDRRFDDIYPESSANYWEWDSFDNRFNYDKKRLETIAIKNREVYFMTAILVNHIISGINAVRLTRKHNRSLAQNAFDYHFVVKPSKQNNNYIGVKMSQSF